MRLMSAAEIRIVVQTRALPPVPADCRRGSAAAGTCPLAIAAVARTVGMVLAYRRRRRTPSTP
jgi:hypothetical protein